MADLAEMLQRTVATELPNLLRMTEEEAARKPQPDKWSPKEELGHLLDSAVNNQVRFVRGATEDGFVGPGYAQDAWVHLQGYQEIEWETLVVRWKQHNLMMARLIGRIPPERLSTECTVAGHRVTLAFLIEDYIFHIQHHLDHIVGRETLTSYPGATL